MYCDYFGFKQEPFSIAPDPAFLYPSSAHRQALAHLKYGLEREGGFILLTGEVGTGKTTLTRLLIEQIPAAFRVAYILNAKLDSSDVLASICDELHIDLPSLENQKPSPKLFIDAINANLLQAHSEGLRTLVVIEEAQNLDQDVLEMLRLLTNLETNTTKLLHILLVGQPELLDLIGLPQLRQLNQRVVSRFHLLPLNRSETESYLVHRLRKAGCSRSLFDRSAINKLHCLSQGIPRKINLLGERALLGAYSQNQDKVSKSHIIQSQKEVFGEDASTKWNGRAWLLGFSLILLVACAYLFVPPLIQDNWLVIESEDTGSRVEISSEEEPVIQSIPAVSQLADELQDLDQTDLQVNSSVAEEYSEQLSDAENSFEKLLSLWGVEADASSIEELCLVAATNNFRCEEIEDPDASILLSINRPTLISLQSSEETSYGFESQQFSLLEALHDSEFRISYGESDWQLDTLEINNQIIGSAYYLWQPPLGFNESLRLGDSNWAVLNWLQPRLEVIDPELSQLITGGRYSQPIQDGVAEFQRRYGLDADGVLGRQTIMMFNQLDQMVPVLVNDNI